MRQYDDGVLIIMCMHTVQRILQESIKTHPLELTEESQRASCNHFIRAMNKNNQNPSVRMCSEGLSSNKDV